MRLLALLVSPLPLILAIPTTAPSGSCAAVTVITARGSTEAQGEGIMGGLAGSIQSGSKQTVSRTAVVYPATLNPYASSVAAGVKAMTAAVKDAVDKCPGQKIVLLGYSQGAQCAGDTLGGGSAAAIDFNTYGSKVKAVIMYGDPRSSSSQTAIHVGTCKGNSINPRSANQALTAYNGVTKSYCDSGDPFCCSGGDMSAHLGYFNKYNSAALQFVLAQIGG
ncbi:Acetylxylan esterase 2 [Phlyctema vagabunda]|uniref:Acetylxylan esterase 2 n=1 Tax=Phlyctema vagabunda TaxID=108571 RepID=A0ABR4P1Q1_9HELO